MRKYIITIATELDGHASSETCFMETPYEYSKQAMLDIMFKDAKIDNELVINHETDDNIYGSSYGCEFSMKVRELEEDIKHNKIYYLSSRTG